MAENETDKKPKQQTDNEKAGSPAGVGAGAIAGAQVRRCGIQGGKSIFTEFINFGTPSF